MAGGADGHSVEQLAAQTGFQGDDLAADGAESGTDNSVQGLQYGQG